MRVGWNTTDPILVRPLVLTGTMGTHMGPVGAWRFATDASDLRGDPQRFLPAQKLWHSASAVTAHRIAQAPCTASLPPRRG